MNKKVNLLMEIPPRNDITMDELKSAMESLGFKWRHCKSSHVVFMHKDRHELYTVVPTPHNGKKVIKEAYIKIIQQLIKQLEEYKEGESNEKS